MKWVGGRAWKDVRDMSIDVPSWRRIEKDETNPGSSYCPMWLLQNSIEVPGLRHFCNGRS